MTETIETEADQREVVDFLAARRSPDGAATERVDTHISRLFLTGDRVLKLRRAVRTNFLDFTTPERREADCRREIEVNVAAPSIYRRVLPVTREADRRLALDGAGEPVDWVVEMARFDRTQEFDRLADDGRLDVALIRRTADVVARMHAESPRTPDYGGAARVMATVRQIAEAIAATRQGASLGEATTDWREAAEAAVARWSRRLDARRRHGFVRRCHGDLHLGNIVLIDGRPTPFDALEFSEEMASTDVLYDLAFVLMDLEERGLRPFANAFLNRYLGATRDYSGLALLPLFVSMRAAVRALVAASRDAPDPHEPGAAERLDFARARLAPGPAPRLIAIGGLSGSGKSTVARLVAPRLGGGEGAVVLRSDEIRKRLLGAEPEERLGAAGYAPEVTERVYRRMTVDGRRALRAGVATILDASFLDPARRAAAEAAAARAGAAFAGLWLDCPEAELVRRLRARTGDASDADAAVLRRQLARAPGPGRWARVDAGGAPEAAAAAALRAIGA